MSANPREREAAENAPPAPPIASAQWRIGGRVQGVGYRPFVYRLAQGLGLSGWVRNSGGIVDIHAQGEPQRVREFGEALIHDAPPAARPCLLEERAIAQETPSGFRILASAQGTGAQIHVPPDLFCCEDCLAELRDPAARRYRYPFINCTQCGPRYTLIEAMPYDRPNTTMARFELCPACGAEYADPLDRRFHAQPLACPACGPTLRWHRAADGPTAPAGNEAALAAAVAALRAGAIVAVRGIGGYHLMCDAGNPAAVERLRARKHRPAKPLALMLPWQGADGLDGVRLVASPTQPEATALVDAARPIVLVARRDTTTLAAGIAPALREVGLMLPYSPLHHLLLDAFGSALVATSGNLSGEPVLTETVEAQARLARIADAFLDHDRPISRPADDPVVRVVAGAARPLRLGRGTAPLELRLPSPIGVPTLATGAFLKTTVALAWDDRAVVSPHIGDLTSPRGRAMFTQVVEDLQRLYGVRAQRLVHDAHPDFPSTRWARSTGLPTLATWHHHAHASAVAGEFPDPRALLCFTWDGVGLGEDGTLWGGEALLGRPGAWQRVASFRPFRLPGGERSARQPWRTALGLCWAAGIEWPAGAGRADPLLRAAFDRGLHAPFSTAVGRLFDAAAALLGVCGDATYEAEAPMRLEALCADVVADPVALPLQQDAAGVWRSDWAPLLPLLLDAARPPAARAAAFHATLSQALCDQAIALRKVCGVTRIGLAGGVFQNRVLSEQVHALLNRAGFEVLMPRELPANDAGISYGQLVEASAAALSAH